MSKVGWRVGLMGALLAVAEAAAAQQTKSSPEKPAEQAAEPARQPGLYLTFETSLGAITCKLFEKEAPITVGRIVGLAIGKTPYQHPRSGLPIRGKRFYDGLTFHRVIPNFMIQGGDPLGTGMGGPRGPGFPFQDEFAPTLKFDVPGRLAMANSGPRTNGSQFFITEVPTPHLNNRHTIFGDCGNAGVVRKIARVPTKPENNKPLTPVVIKRVAVERVGPAAANAPEALPGGPAPRPAAKAPPKKTP